jgi:hypothetical protein
LSTEPETTNEDDLEEVTTDTLSQAQRERLLHIFLGLGKSRRFMDFIENNFHIQEGVDHEQKTIEIQVIEKPIAVGPKMSPSQLSKLYTACKKYGMKEENKFFAELLEILGQEQSDIVLATDGDLRKVSFDKFD